MGSVSSWKVGRSLLPLSARGGRASTTSSGRGRIQRSSVDGHRVPWVARNTLRPPTTSRGAFGRLGQLVWRAAVVVACRGAGQSTLCPAVTCPDPPRLHPGKYSSSSVDWPTVGLAASMRRVRLVKASHLRDPPNQSCHVIGRARFETPSRKMSPLFQTMVFEVA